MEPFGLIAIVAFVFVVALLSSNISHTIVRGWQGSGGSSAISKSQLIDEDVNADAEDNRDVALGSGASNKQIDAAFATARLKSIFMVCDQDTTIYTNDVSGGSPDDTITLKANIPFVWTINSGIPVADVFSADVTTLYATSNASPAAASTLKIRIAKDGTP